MTDFDDKYNVSSKNISYLIYDETVTEEGQTYGCAFFGFTLYSDHVLQVFYSKQWIVFEK
jgi:hypothetical protein